MTYWHGLFSGKTWLHFLKAGEEVLGYRLFRRKQVENNMDVGDVILAYLATASKESRWVGAFEVTGKPFIGKGKCHGEKDLLVRVPVRPLDVDGTKLLLTPEAGVRRNVVLGEPKRDEIGRYFAGGKWARKSTRKFYGWVRGSPQKFKPEGPTEADAIATLEIIKAAAKSPVTTEIRKRFLAWEYKKKPKANAKETDKAGKPKAEEAKTDKAEEAKTDKAEEAKTDKAEKPKAKETKVDKALPQAEARKPQPAAQEKPKKAPAVKVVKTSPPKKVKAPPPKGLSGQESKKLLTAFRKGVGADVISPEDAKKVIDWGQAAKTSKNPNFDFVMKGKVALQVHEGMVFTK